MSGSLWTWNCASRGIHLAPSFHEVSMFLDVTNSSEYVMSAQFLTGVEKKHGEQELCQIYAQLAQILLLEEYASFHESVDLIRCESKKPNGWWIFQAFIIKGVAEAVLPFLYKAFPKHLMLGLKFRLIKHYDGNCRVSPKGTEMFTVTWQLHCAVIQFPPGGSMIWNWWDLLPWI